MDWQSKIERLLVEFFKGRASNNINGGLEKLVSNFKQQQSREIESPLITHPIFTKWVKECVVLWETNKITPTRNLTSFTLSLTSFLSKREDIFCQLNTNNFYIKLVNVLKVRQRSLAPSVTLSYIDLLSSFLEHKSGIEWMTACNFWEDVYQLSLSEDNEKILDQSTKFMSKILETTYNYDFCNSIVRKIMTPLSENIYKSLKASDDVDFCNEIAMNHLKPTLTLMGNILCYFLERKDFRIPLGFFKHFHMEERISDFIIISQNKCLVFELAKIMFLMQFLELYVKIAKKRISIDNVNSSVGRIRTNYLMYFVGKKVDHIVDFCIFGTFYWSLLEFQIPSHLVDPRRLFLIDTAIVLIAPHYFLLFKYFIPRKPNAFEELNSEDDLREMFSKKMLKSISNDCIRICYAFRDTLMSQNIYKTCCESLTHITNLRKYFSVNGAVLIFQMHFYIVKDIYISIKENTRKLHIFLDDPEYLCLIFRLLRLYLQDFHVQWKDSCEIIDIIPLCLDFLTLPTWSQWPSEVINEILKLINISIINYLSPNLALLLDNTKDSSITLLGPLLYSKLYDHEVKMVALEVIHTLATFSSGKFPSLQKVLMDSELPTLVVKMSTCDGESFVRATAIKCLQEMIQVEEIWNNALKSEDLSEKMRHILMNETEGIVRVEAATFMCVAYEHQQFPKESLDGIYETMIYSSTTDLHWEVKVRALNFWDKVIKNHLQNQGMIDDSFPNVTFSKEHRKIVTLTDSEIRKRLLKVLSQLSSIGCLGVLMSAIKDDCDMEVSKTGVKITQRLIDLFKKYNVRSDSSTPSSPAATENGMSAVASVSSGISVDESMDSPASTHPEVNEEVIDQIVNSKDVCLLKNVYTPSDYGSVSNYDIQVRKIVTPNEFLVFCQQDLNSLIAEKKNWLNGIEDLGSLLDDMLKTYDDDVNNMDCY